MKKLLVIVSLILFPVMSTGCEFIGDIFKVGIWVGIIIIIAVIAVIALIVKIFSK